MFAFSRSFASPLTVISTLSSAPPFKDTFIWSNNKVANVCLSGAFPQSQELESQWNTVTESESPEYQVSTALMFPVSKQKLLSIKSTYSVSDSSVEVKTEFSTKVTNWVYFSLSSRNQLSLIDIIKVWHFPSADSYTPKPTPTTDTPLNRLITGNNNREGGKTNGQTFIAYVVSCPLPSSWNLSFCWKGGVGLARLPFLLTTVRPFMFFLWILGHCQSVWGKFKCSSAKAEWEWVAAFSFGGMQNLCSNHWTSIKPHVSICVFRSSF